MADWIEIIREGWRDERADMLKVLTFLAITAALAIGSVVALWIGGAHVPAAVLVGYYFGIWDRRRHA